ncbi:MAG: hypothetical protein HY785_01185 [Oscillatoriophycideae cyanobacterium NC_groundwater_1537_Pr4_S-0.65um_50_18]|nr:hypothetical protein [Oscillatoriophycideae cyanobacterium NC_groundwater_1537_Pr4_S-0.65um_50_18]
MAIEQHVLKPLFIFGKHNPVERGSYAIATAAKAALNLTPALTHPLAREAWGRVT